ncbi:MAG: winged helix-turn-helix domain-containing protein, partial [Acidimicrobiia bacterium]|nr:winged helix-turn-helix domain-containing protein [Acidimicrobiia bacterium]
MLSYLIEVVDREDRLESGSGRFKEDLGADHAALRRAVEESVLRALRMASDPLSFRVLDQLMDHSPMSTSDLAIAVGLPRLAVEERISDLVSAGLASKLSSRGQVAGTQAGEALVAVIR